MAQGSRQVEASQPAPERVRAAPAAPAAAEPALLALQRAAGNSAVAGLMQRRHEASKVAFGSRLGELLYPARVRNALFSVPLRGAAARAAATRRPAGRGRAAAGPAAPRRGIASRSGGRGVAHRGGDPDRRQRAGDSASRDRARRAWRATLVPGERGAVVTSSGTIAGPVLAGVLPDEKIREHALQQLGGRNLPVPGVDGLDVDFQPSTRTST